MADLITLLKKVAEPGRLDLITAEASNDAKKSSSTLLQMIKDHDKNRKLKLKFSSDSSSRALVVLVNKYIEKGMSGKSLDSILKLLNKVIPATSPGDSNQQVVMNKIRQAIRSKYGGIDSDEYKQSLNLMQFDREKWTKNRTQYFEKVYERNKDRIIFIDTEIYKIMDEILKANLQRPDYAALVIAAELACGARSVEILIMSDFEVVPGMPHHVKQTGIAKEHEGQGLPHRNSVVKPIIHYSVERFLKVIKEIRDQIGETKINQVREKAEDDPNAYYAFSNSQNTKLNRRAKELFRGAQNGDKVRTHMLRKMYASLAYQTYANKAKVSEAAYLSQILGHAEGSLGVSLSYSTVSVQVTDNTPARIGVVESKTNDNDTAINEISTRLDKLQKDLQQTGRGKTNIAIRMNLRLRDGRASDRLADTVADLKERGLPISNKILRTYGYGAKLVNAYMKANKHPRKKRSVKKKVKKVPRRSSRLKN